MNTEALQRLREPAAFALLGAVGLQLLAGLINLFSYGGFTLNAYGEAAGYGLFANLNLALISVGVVLLVTRGASPTPQARTVVMAALGLVGAALVLGLISLLAGLVAEGMGGAAKAAMFFWGVSKLVLGGAAGYFVFLNFQAMQPPRPAAMPGTGGQVYGAQQYGAPDPYGQQQGQGQPQYGQQYPQEGGYPQYGQPAAPSQQPQQYGAPDPYGQQQGQQPGQQGQGQPGQPQYGQPQYGQPDSGYGQQPQYGQPQQQPDHGQWTRQFGEEQSSPPQQSDQNWYRGDQGPQ